MISTNRGKPTTDAIRKTSRSEQIYPSKYGGGARGGVQLRGARVGRVWNVGARRPDPNQGDAFGEFSYLGGFPQ